MIISPENPKLQYSGRIDFSNPAKPIFVYAASYVKCHFSGKSLSVLLTNHHSYYENAVGYILDGTEGKIILSDSDVEQTYVIAQGLAEEEHEILLYKRMDGCHYYTFGGFLTEGEGKLYDLPSLPNRRMEVFGDSVSCGEVCEAIDRVAMPDPENHNGIYSNSYYSYSWIAARKLQADLHITSQGGAALLDGTGWFNGPNFVGMETIYDKIQYNENLGGLKKWNFNDWIPQVVVFAIGQNDNNPHDWMVEDFDSEQSLHWRKRYRDFAEKIMRLYPGVHIIFTTTILGHDISWDKAIDRVCEEINSPNVTRFYYSKNGCGTPGHIRIPEAEEMACELSDYINSLGDVWNEH